jgi:hypothetical protein
LKNLTLGLSEELSILDKYGLTPNELLVLRILLLLQDDNEEELFKKLIVTLKSIGVSLREVLIELQNKEVILKSWKVPTEGSSFDPFVIPINKNFIKNLYKCSFELGKELFDTYPQWTVINNSTVSLRGVSKHFNSLEECYFKYGKAIGWNPERHQTIIDLVNWAKENNILSKSLGAFVVDNGWYDLEALREMNNHTDTILL